jgi:hypothetical protein
LLPIEKNKSLKASKVNDEDYIVVTLENLEGLPRRMIGPYKCGVCSTKIKYFHDMRQVGEKCEMLL